MGIRNSVFTPEQLAQNDAIRAQVMARSRRIRQAVPVTIPSSGYTAGQALQIPVQIQNTGLLEKFIVRVEFDVAQSAAETHTRTVLGLANAFSNILFQDFNNNQRINCPLRALLWRKAGIGKVIPGAAYTTDNPFGFGSIYNVNNLPSPVTTQQTVYLEFEIPIAYSDWTLEGAVYAGLASSNAYLTFTVNPNFFVSSTGNPVQAVYQSSTAALGRINAIRMELIQQYRDNLPMANVNGAAVPLLPPADLAAQYMIYSTVQGGLVVNGENLFNFTNQREHRSTTFIYDNAGVLSATGADVNYFALKAANQSVLDRRTPLQAKFYERMIVGDDYPRGVYYFDWRESPIDTMASGNTQMAFNPAVVTSNLSQLLVDMEFVAITATIANAAAIGS